MKDRVRVGGHSNPFLPDSQTTVDKDTAEMSGSDARIRPIHDFGTWGQIPRTRVMSQRVLRLSLERMSPPESKLRWYVAFAFTTLALTIISVVLLRLPFDIPLSRLSYPAISLVALFVLSAPMIYRGRSIARARRDLRLISISIGTVLVGGALLVDFWAWSFGIISPDFARGYALTCFIAGPVSIFCGYHLTKRILNS